MKRTFLLLLILCSLVVSGCGKKGEDAYTISGRITVGNTAEGLPGVPVLCGDFGIAISDGDGYWRKDGLIGAVQVIPQKPGWTFVPSARQVHAQDGEVDFAATYVTVVTFEDHNLEHSIREALGKPDGGLSVADLQSITKLDVCGRGIASLDGIEHLAGLQTLLLDHNKISSVAPLEGLTNLKYLSLERNQLEDISPLVNNVGFGHRALLNVAYNLLDLTPGGADQEAIQVLLNRGVTVFFEPQRTGLERELYWPARDKQERVLHSAYFQGCYILTSNPDSFVRLRIPDGDVLGSEQDLEIVIAGEKWLGLEDEAGVVLTDKINRGEFSFEPGNKFGAETMAFPGDHYRFDFADEGREFRLFLARELDQAFQAVPWRNLSIRLENHETGQVFTYELPGILPRPATWDDQENDYGQSFWWVGKRWCEEVDSRVPLVSPGSPQLPAGYGEIDLDYEPSTFDLLVDLEPGGTTKHYAFVEKVEDGLVSFTQFSAPESTEVYGHALRFWNGNPKSLYYSANPDQEHYFKYYYRAMPGSIEIGTDHLVEEVVVPGAAWFPIGEDDYCTEVDYPYYMSKYEVTYGLWKTVYDWATSESRGEARYHFQNPGAMGFQEESSSVLLTEYHPVTRINWRDAVVWCNALTEYANATSDRGLLCVYVNGREVLRDSRDSNGSNCDNASARDANGYRLPSSMEWELAARYVDGQEWLPGNHVSGDQTGPVYPEDSDQSLVFGDYAWYKHNSDHSTHPVGAKLPNALGIYDLSGNVREWCFGNLWGDRSHVRAIQGGSWSNGPDKLQLGSAIYGQSSDSGYDYGIRLARTRGAAGVEDLPDGNQGAAVSYEEAMEYLVIRQINQERAKHGLHPVERDEDLTRIARDYSRDMGVHGYFTHESPTLGSFATRMRNAGYETFRKGENIARSPDATLIHGLLMASKQGHRENLLDPAWTHVGVGLYDDGESFYATQIFLVR